MRAKISLVVFFFFVGKGSCDFLVPKDNFVLFLENSLENKLCDYAVTLTGWLGEFNDNHIGNSDIGRYLHYEDIKKKIVGNSRGCYFELRKNERTGRKQKPHNHHHDDDDDDDPKKSRGIKKMSMAMMPLVFHVGATSTWMLLTSIMAAKSVLIGLALLVFKIAVSSAKVASFFTALKGKDDNHHHGWGWTPHHDHHDHKRSLSSLEHQEYKTIEDHDIHSEELHAHSDKPYGHSDKYEHSDKPDHFDKNEHFNKPFGHSDFVPHSDYAHKPTDQWGSSKPDWSSPNDDSWDSYTPEWDAKEEIVQNSHGHKVFNNYDHNKRLNFDMRGPKDIPGPIILGNTYDNIVNDYPTIPLPYDDEKDEHNVDIRSANKSEKKDVEKGKRDTKNVVKKC